MGDGREIQKAQKNTTCKYLKPIQFQVLTELKRIVTAGDPHERYALLERIGVG